VDGKAKDALLLMVKACDALSNLHAEADVSAAPVVATAVSGTWLALIAGQPAEAVRLGERALIPLEETHAGRPHPLRVNLAHGYLLQGRLDEAKNIYTRYAGTQFEDGRGWNEEVLNDFKLLSAAAHDHGDMKKIEALLPIDTKE